MLGSVLRGMVAAAMGTVALDITTSMDMAIRGRSSSNTPSKLIHPRRKNTSSSLVSRCEVSGSDSSES
jgi:hypothetical protein